MPGIEPLDLLQELDRLEAGQSPERRANRKFQRFHVRFDAELHPIAPSQLDRTPLDIKLRDIGLGGIGFLSEVPLEPGSTWRVAILRHGYVVAQQGLVIRHCRRVGTALYLAGAQFCLDTGVLALMGIDLPRAAFDDQSDFDDQPDGGQEDASHDAPDNG